MIGYIIALVIACILVAIVLFYIIMYKKVYILDDNITYKVLVARPNKHTALKILYDLNHNSMDLIKNIKNKYADRLKLIKVDKLTESTMSMIANSDLLPTEIRGIVGVTPAFNATEPDTCDECIKLILQNYNPDLLVENDPMFTFGDKTYTLNFRRIAICIRNKNWTFYDFNTLMFVFLHEIAHTGTHTRFLTINGKRDNHPPMFWRIFKFLLKEAVAFGYIVPIEYSKNNYITYCGINIQNNPLFDNSIKDLI